ncbi:beta-glucosidase [Saccharothrix sp. ALI-22-I]|nr:beta-glucosidase [Saccharothrix sp. ALI-22-I]
MRKFGMPARLLSVGIGAVLVAVLYGVSVDGTALTSAAPPPGASGPESSGSGSSVPESSVPGSSVTESAAPAPPVDACAGTIAALPPRARLAQLLMVGVNPRGPDEALGLVQGEQAGGIFIGGDDVGLLSGGALEQVRAAAAVPLTVAVDDEGGRVQRIEALDGDMPSAREMAQGMSPDQVRAVARERGEAMRARGVTTDLAPVVDTANGPDRTVIGDRSFSADPQVAAAYAVAFAQGLHDAGVTPVIKHFPGHGNTTGDSHLGAVRSPSLAELRGNDLVPYQDIARYGEAVVMLGHIDVPGLTEGQPASLSPAAYSLLRDEYAFDGPAMTDDLGAMRAVTDRFALPDAVVVALKAGADIALWTSGGRLTEVLDRLESAVATGELPAARVDQALRRVLAAKDAC